MKSGLLAARLHSSCAAPGVGGAAAGGVHVDGDAQLHGAPAGPVVGQAQVEVDRVVGDVDVAQVDVAGTGCRPPSASTRLAGRKSLTPSMTMVCGVWAQDRPARRHRDQQRPAASRRGRFGASTHGTPPYLTSESGRVTTCPRRATNERNRCRRPRGGPCVVATVPEPARAGPAPGVLRRGCAPGGRRTSIDGQATRAPRRRRSRRRWSSAG